MKSADTIRVLLVEDSESDAFLIRTALRRLPEPIELVHVETLADGRKELESGDYDVLLSDLNLPDSGHATTVEFLTRVANRIPTVALNGCDDAALKGTCASQGICCYSKQQLFSPAFGQALRDRIGLHCTQSNQ